MGVAARAAKSIARMDQPSRSRLLVLRRAWCAAALALLVLVSARTAAQQEDNKTMVIDLGALKGKAVRVYYNVLPPAVELNEDGTYGGYLVTLMESIAEEGGFDIELVDLEALIEEHGSPWSACPLGVMAGEVDVCVGTFWETAGRREIVGFTGSLFQATFMLVVPTSIVAGGGFGQVFYPFTTELWIVIIGSIALVSVVLFLVESGHGEDFETHFWSHPYAVVHSLFLGYVGFLQAGPAHNPKTLGGRIIVFGYAFFILVGCASYTANLAASLTVAAEVTSFNSLAAIEASGARACVDPPSQPILSKAYPGLRYEDLSSNSHDMAQALLGGVTDPYAPVNAGRSCSGSVVYVEEFEWFEDQMICSLKFVGKPLFTYPVAFPVSRGVEPVLSFYVAKHRNNGNIAASLPVPPDICGNITTHTESSRLTPSQMSGTLSILGGSLVIGVIVAAVSHLQLRKKGPKTPNKVGVVSRVLGKASEVEVAVSDDAQDIQSMAFALKSLTQTVASLGDEIGLLREEARSGISGNKWRETHSVVLPCDDELPA